MSWSLSGGSLLAVTGPSGIGKSSLIECLQSRLEPTSGSFSIGGTSANDIGVIYQNLRLTGELSVLKNVLCGKLGDHAWWQTLAGFSDEDERAAFAIITELGLKDLVHKPVKHISGGEKQRTAIARVLLHDPAIILADEPTSNLDQALAEQVMQRLKDLTGRGNKIVIAVLHDRELVERFADLELHFSGEGDGWELREVSAQR